MSSFFVAIRKSGNVIFNLLFFYLLFSTLGLNSFKDNLEYRCRLSPDPVINNNQTIWLADESQPFLCAPDQDGSCNPGLIL